MLPAQLTALAGFVRACLAELTELTGRQTSEPATQPTAVVVTAAPVFAANPYARARLLRQLHACGLLDEGRVEKPQTARCVGVAQ